MTLTSSRPLPRPPSLPPPQRDLSVLYEDVMRLAGAETAVPVDFVNRAQRLLLANGGYDVEAARRAAQSLTVKVRGAGAPWARRGAWRAHPWERAVRSTPY